MVRKTNNKENNYSNGISARSNVKTKIEYFERLKNNFAKTDSSDHWMHSEKLPSKMPKLNSVPIQMPFFNSQESYSSITASFDTLFKHENKKDSRQIVCSTPNRHKSMLELHEKEFEFTSSSGESTTFSDLSSDAGLGDDFSIENMESYLRNLSLSSQTWSSSSNNSEKFKFIDSTLMNETFSYDSNDTKNDETLISDKSEEMIRNEANLLNQKRINLGKNDQIIRKNYDKLKRRISRHESLLNLIHKEEDSSEFVNTNREIQFGDSLPLQKSQLFRSDLSVKINFNLHSQNPKLNRKNNNLITIKMNGALPSRYETRPVQTNIYSSYQNKHMNSKYENNSQMPMRKVINSEDSQHNDERVSVVKSKISQYESKLKFKKNETPAKTNKKENEMIKNSGKISFPIVEFQFDETELVTSSKAKPNVIVYEPTEPLKIKIKQNRNSSSSSSSSKTDVEQRRKFVEEVEKPVYKINTYYQEEAAEQNLNKVESVEPKEIESLKKAERPTSLQKAEDVTKTNSISLKAVPNEIKIVKLNRLEPKIETRSEEEVVQRRKQYQDSSATSWQRLSKTGTENEKELSQIFQQIFKRNMQNISPTTPTQIITTKRSRSSTSSRNSDDKDYRQY